jgi:ferredoxin
MNMKIIIDREVCTGCGVCVSICRDMFELDEESVAVVTKNPVPANLKTTVKEAAESCAVEAIHLEE